MTTMITTLSEAQYSISLLTVNCVNFVVIILMCNIIITIIVIYICLMIMFNINNRIKLDNWIAYSKFKNWIEIEELKLNCSEFLTDT